MMTDELIDAVRNWGREKGINNADKQLMKVFEETNEIIRGDTKRYQFQRIDADGNVITERTA